MTKAIPADLLEKRIQELDRRLTDLHRQTREALNERNWTKRLLAQAISLDRVLPAGEPQKGTAVQDGAGPPPSDLPMTDLLVRYVADHPGVRPVNVVDYFENRIASSSKDKRKMLYTVIGNLQRKGRLATRSGKLYEPGLTNSNETGGKKA